MRLIILLLFFGMGQSLAWGLESREISPTMKNISRFEDDRIAFHYIHNLDSKGNRFPGSDPKLDPSLATLVVIKSSQTYLFMDGHDSRREVANRIQEYQKAVAKYRSRRAFLKDFKDIQDEKRKWESQPEDFRKGKTEDFGRQFHTLFMKQDSIYKSIEMDIKKAKANEYRQKRFAGENSPSHKKAKEHLESLNQELEERAKLLTSSLESELNSDPNTTSSESNNNQSATKETSSRSQPENQETKNNSNPNQNQSSKIDSNPGSNPNSKPNQENRAAQPLEPAPNPGEWADMNFYENSIDGEVDFISYSRSARSIDFEKKDMGESKKVQEKYGKLYDSMVDRLFTAHVEKFRYYYARQGETASRKLIEDNPLTKGKRIIFQLTDNTRYLLEDWDGDGKVETFEVSNASLPFRYASDSANIISVTNCRVEKICKHFENLIKEVESGSFTTLGEVKKYGTGMEKILGNEDELIRDWEERIRKLP